MPYARSVAALLILAAATVSPAWAERGGVALGWLIAVGPSPEIAAEAAAFADEARAAAAGAAEDGADPGAGAAVVLAATVSEGAGHVADASRAADAEEGDAAALRLSLGAAFDAEVLRYRRTRPVPETPDDAAAFRALGVAGLRDLIASVESGKTGYDAIHHSAKRLPVKKPSQMTIAEIQQWIADTPGQQHAIGRYQVVPNTLGMLVARLGVSGTVVYSPALQDRFADSLLADAGLAQFLAGTLNRETFMTNVAAIWAGLPAANGKSVYHGYAGNSAGMSWAEYQNRLAVVFPSQGQPGTK